MDDKIKVKNRSAGVLVYSIPEDRIRREFQPGETRVVTRDELYKLTYQSGGDIILKDFLQIVDYEKINGIEKAVEPEYFMSERQIEELLKTGSLDAFLDCLDFAPVGVIDLVKKISVILPLENHEKKKALKNKTGFDVDAAIRHLEEEKEDVGEVKEEPSKRRVTEESAPARRTSSKYKIVESTN